MNTTTSVAAHAEPQRLFYAAALEVNRMDLQTEMAAAPAYGSEAEVTREVRAWLDKMPNAVRVRDGGGVENLAASLAVNIARLELHAGERDTNAIARIAAQVQADDGQHCTSHPQFVVQQRHRITGIDTEYTEDIAWIDDGDEVTDPIEHALLEAAFATDETVPEGYIRTGYVDRRETVQVFFSQPAAQTYIDANRHRLTDPSIYVDSAHRNPEWQALRAFLLGADMTD